MGRAKQFKSLRGNPAKHGTTSTYNLHGCRCPECRKAISDYRKDYTARLRKTNRKDRKGRKA